MTDFRTPAFDLDNLYGRGPDDQPYMYSDDKNLLLGDPIQGGGDAGACDLARNTAPIRRALIGDPRNDENSIVSQLHGLFTRFHNRMVADNTSLSFASVQHLVRLHYQYVIFNDYLPRIIGARVLDELRTDGRFDPTKLKFFKPTDTPFMPVEFSVAAYRLGHSMIRPGYRLNDTVLQPIFPSVPPQPGMIGLTGFKAMIPSWGIDWGRFIDIDTRAYDGDDAVKKRRLQFAYRLDTSLVNPLSTLPSSVASDPPPSLAGRNLLRGWRLGLPSGQSVAHRMGIVPLADADILIGMAVTNAPTFKSIDTVSSVFRGNCPLWTYVLAEAIKHQTKVKLPVTENVEITMPQLGPVGGRIVAEVFLGLAHADKTSLLHSPAWLPAKGADYKLKDLVNYALNSTLRPGNQQP